jgi:hypothetical protein
MEFIDKYAKQLNPTQKNIAACIVSVVILILTIAAARSVSGNQYHSGKAFDFEDTWFPWVIGFSLIGYILTRLYATVNRK